MALVWVATAPIKFSNVLAFNPGNVVPDSVVARFGLDDDGLVEQVEGSTAPGPSYGVNPVTQAELDALVSGTGRLSDVSLRAASVAAGREVFAPWPAGGNSVLVDGESTTRSITNHAVDFIGYSWPLYAELISGSRINVVRNAAIGGTTMAQVLARFDTDVGPYAPTTVVLTEGTNDILQGTSFATWSAGIAAYHAKCKAIGARLVLGTIPPLTDSTLHPKIATWNAWLRRYALLNGLSVVDFHSVLTDPVTGRFLAAVNSADGVHPGEAGYRLMGAEAARVLAPTLPHWAPPLVRHQGDTTNMLTGGSANILLINDTNADGIPDGWAASGPATGYTHSLVTDSNVAGKMIRIAIDSSAAAGAPRSVLRSTSSGFAVGDRLAFCGVITTSSDMVKARVKCMFNPTGKTLVPAEFTGPVTRGVFYAEAVVPTGCTNVQVQVEAEPGAAAGSATVDFGQPTLLNLTQLGLL